MSTKKTEQRTFLSLLEKIFLGHLLVVALGGGAVFGLLLSNVASGSELTLLANYRPSLPTRLYDRNGVIFAELYRHRQELVYYQDIPPHVIQAFLAVEDDNFFNHIGLDFMGIFRAAIKNIQAGHIVQGGSTLTQQMAKQIYLNAEGKRDRTFFQKIRETVFALQIEEELSKEEILEVFFNAIYLGHGCRGLSCAARLYFDKGVQDLTLAEGAVLARLPRAPVEYSPFKNPQKSREQHLYVLNRMAESGYVPQEQVKTISDNFWRRYWGEVIVRAPTKNLWGERLNLVPYFTDYVRQMLEAADEVGPDRLYQEGLRVYTTLDLQHQKIADEEMQKTLKEANKVGRLYAAAGGKNGVDNDLFHIFSQLSTFLPVGKVAIRSLDTRGQLRKYLEKNLLDSMQLLTYLTPARNEAVSFGEFRKDTISYTTNLEVQGAFLAVEPRSGFITAMIGGSKFSPQNQFNRALMARRQPGSAFKVFVYGAALERRLLSTTSPLNDAPFLTIAADGTTWSPGNYGGGFRGVVPAHRALALSLNICSVQVYFRAGPQPIIDLASRLLKVSNVARFHPDPALALGTSEVTPLEMSTAMAIIANDGRDVIPFAIRYVLDQSSNIIYNQEARVHRALAIKAAQNRLQIIEPALAFILRKMMRGVADHGTARNGLRMYDQGNFSGDVACKTGTTSSWSNAWITGFNPEYVTTIWFGFDKSSITLGPGQSGGHMAAPVMGSFFRRIYQEQNKPYPAFRDRTDQGKAPQGTVRAPCNGWALIGKKIGGRYRAPPQDGICEEDGGRIYDQREVLMKELGITPEDLGTTEGRIYFKRGD